MMKNINPATLISNSYPLLHKLWLSVTSAICLHLHFKYYNVSHGLLCLTQWKASLSELWQRYRYLEHHL